MHNEKQLMTSFSFFCLATKYEEKPSYDDSKFPNAGCKHMNSKFPAPAGITDVNKKRCNIWIFSMEDKESATYVHSREGS